MLQHFSGFFPFRNDTEHTQSPYQKSENYKAEKNVLMSRHTFFTLFFPRISPGFIFSVDLDFKVKYTFG
jgi:hypothetical protein